MTSAVEGNKFENVPNTHQISVVDLRKALEHKKIHIIDVRKPDEVEQGRIEGSINIPIAEIKEAFELTCENFKAKYGFDKPAIGDDNVVLHCMGGGRSGKALRMLHELGYTNFHHLAGGYGAWTETK